MPEYHFVARAEGSTVRIEPPDGLPTDRASLFDLGMFLMGVLGEQGFQPAAHDLDAKTDLATDVVDFVQGNGSLAFARPDLWKYDDDDDDGGDDDGGDDDDDDAPWDDDDDDDDDDDPNDPNNPVNVCGGTGIECQPGYRAVCVCIRVIPEPAETCRWGCQKIPGAENQA
jgi:hypothetical protein